LKKKLKIDHRKLLRFFLAGGPTFVGAVLLNFALVEWLEWGTALAYAIVLAVQTTANFFVCRLFVFDSQPAARLWKSFALFFNGIIVFRLADWLVYVLLTKYFGFPFVAVQLLNVVLFGLLKFEFARRVFERGPEPGRAPTDPPGPNPS
jgi:putative flippase GtrA